MTSKYLKLLLIIFITYIQNIAQASPANNLNDFYIEYSNSGHQKVGYHPFHYACYQGYYRIVTWMLNSDSSLLDKKSIMDLTPLMCAVMYTRENDTSEKVKTVETLIERGANTEASAVAGQKAVHYAAMSGKVALLQALNRGGADLFAETSYGTTPLANAVSGGSLTIASYIFSTGGDVSKPIRQGDKWTYPIFFALVDNELAPPMIQLLVELGADLEVENGADYYFTPMQAAVQRKSLNLVKCLVSFGANPLNPGSAGMTALDMAIDDKNDQISKYLFLHIHHE